MTTGRRSMRRLLPSGRGRPGRLVVDAAMGVGAGLLAWSAGIHLELWDTGYRALPTIGWLFLLQAVTGFALAVLVLATRRTYAALAGAAFLASTIGGLVWSVEWGLFGFQDSFDARFATESLGVEAAGVAVLSAAAFLRLRHTRRLGRRRRRGVRLRLVR